MAACNSTETKKQSTDSLTKEAVNTLGTVLKEQQEWVKVHAAEFLVWTGNDQGVKQAYLKELEQYVSKPQYRIGIWRVLSQVSTGEEQKGYQDNIRNAFLDTSGPDRLHAIETMAKLKMSPLPEYKAEADAALRSDVKSLVGYTHWATAYTNADSMAQAKKYFLSRILDVNEDLLLKRIAAYVLRNSGALETTDWRLLKDFVLTMPQDAEARLSFLNAALLTTPAAESGSDEHKKLQAQFLSYGNQKDKSVRMDLAAALAVIGTEEHLPVLTAWMRNSDPLGKPADDADVQASAANAVIQINKRLQVSE